MAWNCKECGDFFMFGYSKKYCSEECYDDKKERKKVKKLKKQQKKTEEDNIKKQIIEYKDNKNKQIKNKYDTTIDYISNNNDSTSILFSNFSFSSENKIKIVSKNARFKDKITLLKNENNEIKKALKELENIINYPLIY